MFGELQRGPAMADGEVAGLLWPWLASAFLQRLLERPFIHVCNQVIGARPKLHAVVRPVPGTGCRHRADGKGGDESFQCPYPFHDQPPE